MKKILFLAFAIGTLSLFAQKDVYLNINHLLGSQPFSTQTTASNNLGNSFKVNRLQYYVAEIVLIHDGGIKTPVTDKYLLVNAKNLTNELLGSFNISTLEGIQFGIGVDQLKNHADPSSYPSNHPLAPKSPSMHWGWSAGYRFVAMEGKAGASFAYTFEIHALDDANYFVQTIPTSGIINGNDLTIQLDADYQKAIENIDVNSGLIIHGSTGDAVQLLQNFSWNVFTSSDGNAAMNVEENEILELKVYPNPASGKNVSIEGFEEDMTANVLDMTGKIVQSSNDGNISTSTLSNGVYFISVFKDSEVIAIEKLMVKK